MTAIAWLPSASAAGTAKGEAHGCAGPPSTSQLKATGRLALNSIVGRRLRLSGGGAFVIVIVGGGARAATAPKASTRPAPTAVGPKAPTGRAVATSAARTWAAEAPGLACRTRAATAAACGAAAEVPKKRQTPRLGEPEEGVGAAVGRGQVGLGDRLLAGRRRRRRAGDRAEVVLDRAARGEPLGLRGVVVADGADG